MTPDHNQISHNIIVNQARSMGFTCQKTPNQEWKIYLPNDYVLSQTETEWRLSVGGNGEISLETPDVLEFLGDLQS